MSSLLFGFGMTLINSFWRELAVLNQDDSFSLLDMVCKYSATSAAPLA